jgi:CPW-WPC domain-containing protein
LCEFQGWSEASAGVCTAPGSYNAPCAAYAYFSAMSSADKMLFEKRCEVCWPCGEAAPIAPPSPSGPVAFTQVSSNARAPEHPTLNLHVVEPNDAAGARELEQESRDMKERLAQLESRRLDLKKRMASMMASVTQDIEDLLAMTGHAAKETKSVAFLASQVLPVDAYKIRRCLSKSFCWKCVCLFKSVLACVLTASSAGLLHFIRRCFVLLVPGTACI